MIQQSTTYGLTFYLVLTADLSPATGVTPTVSISKAGSAFGAAAGAVTEIGSGWYKCALTTADTASLGDLSVNCTASLCEATYIREQIVNFGPLSGGIDTAEVELAAIPGVTGTVRQKIGALYQYLLLKRTITSTTETMYKNDGSTILGTNTVADDGTTATKGKIA